MRVFQYWHDGEPPREVTKFIRSWSDDPDFEHTLYDRTRAARLIRDCEGADAEKAFLACRVPAMQSDLFRLIVTRHMAGLYVDADLINRGGVRTLLAEATCGAIRRFDFYHHKFVANDFIYAAAPQTPLLVRAVDTALRNISERKHGIVHEYAGPGIFRDAFVQGGWTSEIKGWIVLDQEAFQTCMSWVARAAYKTSGRYQQQMSMVAQDPRNFFDD